MFVQRKSPFMKQLVLFLFFVSSLSLAASGDKDFFVRIMPDREAVYAGDSMIVSVLLYAKAPIARAESLSDFKINGKCRVRRLDIDRDATASRVREGHNIYYTLVWAQYVVAPAKAGSYTVPRQKFKAVLQEVVSMPDLFDQMMGARPEYREYKAAGQSEAFTFEAKEKPLRSTREMMRNTQVL